jgi:hypothetical protein
MTDLFAVLRPYSSPALRDLQYFKLTTKLNEVISPVVTLILPTQKVLFKFIAKLVERHFVFLSLLVRNVSVDVCW